MKIAAGVTTAIIMFVILISAAVTGALSALLGSTTRPPSQTALDDIPADYLTLYRQAATICPGLDWTILAAIGKIETNHGRSHLPGVRSGHNEAGAGGPMQLLEPTWDSIIARHEIPPGGLHSLSRYNPHDAIYAAAYYLCDNGARRGDLQAAIFAYNHAQWYVRDVLTQAKRYAAIANVGTGDCTTIQVTNTTAWTAINYACGQRGLPYVWGGNGVKLTELSNGQTQVTGGFDCSGLTRAAYAAAGIQIPRTAQGQYNVGPHVPPGQQILPGDLVFFGTSPNVVTHVGIAISATEMINAPHQGAVVRIEKIWRSNLLGATRPAATRAS